MNPHVEPVEASLRCHALHPARFVHQCAHLTNGILKSDEDRFADEEVTDVQFSDFRDCGDGFHIVVGQAVAGMDLESHPVGRGRAFPGRIQVERNRSLITREHCLAIGARAEFDDR